MSLRTDSIPLWAKWRAVLATVAMQRPCAFAQAAWLKTGPYSGRIVQALFCVPFTAEEVSDDPAETMAAIYLKLRRHWPVYPYASVIWLVGTMRDWWGGLPGESLKQEPLPHPPRSAVQDGDEEDDGDWEPPDEFECEFTFVGARRIYDLTRHFSGSVDLAQHHRRSISAIRRRFLNDEISRETAKEEVESVLREALYDVDASEFQESDEFDEDDYENEEMDRDDAWSAASDMVDDW